jgi:hypothetical protein
MPLPRDGRLVALFLSLALHAAVLTWAARQFSSDNTPEAPRPEKVISLEMLRAPPPSLPRPVAQPGRAAPQTAVRQPASMEAPPAPTAQDWALAATYTLKNSKRYRYTWGQQVRSMMGTAVEGPGQGVVRFRIEIAPDGSLARLDTLWTTSEVAERLARKAIRAMPALPPTPTGKALVFERTITFQPYASDPPPIYANDCEPDPPPFRNPFAWDGKSPQVPVVPEPVTQPDAQELEECRRQLAQDSIEAESAHDQRQLDRWGSGKLAR